jgi:putative acetyltransferase
MTLIAIETPDRPEVLELLAASDAFAASLYPAESNHMVNVETLRKPEVTFLVARVDSQAVGCGAIVKSKDWAEIKRMFVAPAARGRQVGRRLLERLESIARTQGCTALRLETGIRQPAALELYRTAGFVEIGPFGDYGRDPLSVFMEKRLDD